MAGSKKAAKVDLVHHVSDKSNQQKAEHDDSKGGLKISKQTVTLIHPFLSTSVYISVTLRHSDYSAVLLLPMTVFKVAFITPVKT